MGEDHQARLSLRCARGQCAGDGGQIEERNTGHWRWGRGQVTQGLVFLNTQNKLKSGPHIYIFGTFKRHFSKYEFQEAFFEIFGQPDAQDAMWTWTSVDTPFSLYVKQKQRRRPVLLWRKLKVNHDLRKSTTFLQKATIGWDSGEGSFALEILICEL